MALLVLHVDIGSFLHQEASNGSGRVGRVAFRDIERLTNLRGRRLGVRIAGMKREVGGRGSKGSEVHERISKKRERRGREGGTMTGWREKDGEGGV